MSNGVTPGMRGTRSGSSGRSSPSTAPSSAGSSTTNRGHAAVVEATVAASRLDVPSYDRETLLDRLAYFESVVETAGGERERAAFERVCDLVAPTGRVLCTNLGQAGATTARAAVVALLLDLPRRRSSRATGFSTPTSRLLVVC